MAVGFIVLLYVAQIGSGAGRFDLAAAVLKNLVLSGVSCCESFRLGTVLGGPVAHLMSSDRKTASAGAELCLLDRDGVGVQRSRYTAVLVFSFLKSWNGLGTFQVVA